MNRTPRRSRLWIVLAVFAVAVCVGAFAFSPQVEAGSTCTTYVNSPEHWGKGANCAAATADLEAQLDAYVNYACSPEGPCNYSIVITQPCWGSNPVTIDGYARFRCRIDPPGGPGGP